MNTTTKKQEFIDRVKGKPTAKDMFGITICLGDWIVWGAGSRSASGLNFGRIVKINYHPSGRYVSSMTTIKMTKANKWNISADNKEYHGFVKSPRKAICSNYSSAMVMSAPPNKIVETILGDIEIPNE